MTNSLALPLYQKMPRRTIPGTGGCVAATSHASKDRSVREYVLFSPEGETIGRVSSHSKRLGLSAGYHEGHRAYDHRLRCFSNLTEAANYFMAHKEA